MREHVEASRSTTSVRDGNEPELHARLARANERIDRLREATDRTGNAVRFRMARHLESLDELEIDLNERSRHIPAVGTHGRRMFERDLGSLEDEITHGFAELGSATADEHGGARRQLRADLRLLDVNDENRRRWWRRMFGRGGTDVDPQPDPASRPTDEGGGASGTTR